MRVASTRFGFLVALLCLSLQVGNARAGAILPNVVVAHPVIMPLVAGMLDGVTKPHSIMTHVADAHSGLLTPSDVAKLNEADIIIAADDSVSAALTPWLKEKKNPRAMVLVLTRYEAASVLPYRTGNAFMPDEKTIVKAITDPHIWLDPLRMALVLPVLAKDVASYSPEYAARITANAQSLVLHLRAVTYPKTQAMITKAEQESRRFTPAYPITPVLTQHDAFQYFYERYGISDGGYLARHSGRVAGASSLSKLYDRAGKLRVRCILASEPSPLVDKVRDLSKARIVTANPERLPNPRDVRTDGWATNDYDLFIAQITQQFASCLR